MRVKLTRRRFLLLLILAALIAGAVQLNRTQLWEDRQVYAGWRVQRHVILPTCRLLDDQHKTREHGLFGACAAALEAARREEGLAPVSTHLVILLHGMGRSPFLFRDMERALRAAGFDAVAVSYPSLTRDIAGHADQIEHLLEGARDVEKVSFVSHSLGGLVVREVLNRNGAWRDELALGRVVMIAPPNQGSELAESVADLPPYHWIGGPAASEIAAGPPFAPVSPEIEVAIIAGGTDGGNGFNPLLSENNDGVVTVSETYLPGASDHIVVRALHTFITGDPQTIAATRKFLETGRLR
ncbi:alpha/beta fold hydrolase [Pelagibius marinus]|uniref:alpha/beta fold hydrolase n=1 Tax=Pelagibius marinus TaxID=2762760 RepID=UPI00187263E6|nr:alpha/beta fold hydrolase [Pelagibius marinus]